MQTPSFPFCFRSLFTGALLFPLLSQAFVGGTAFDPSQKDHSPYLSNLVNFNSCGGVLLGEEVVLSVSHCSGAASRTGVKGFFKGLAISAWRYKDENFKRESISYQGKTIFISDYRVIPNPVPGRDLILARLESKVKLSHPLRLPSRGDLKMLNGRLGQKTVLAAGLGPNPGLFDRGVVNFIPQYMAAFFHFKRAQDLDEHGKVKFPDHVERRLMTVFQSQLNPLQNTTVGDSGGVILDPENGVLWGALSTGAYDADTRTLWESQGGRLILQGLPYEVKNLEKVRILESIFLVDHLDWIEKSLSELKVTLANPLDSTLAKAIANHKSLLRLQAR